MGMHDPENSLGPPGKGWMARAKDSLSERLRRWLGAKAVSPPQRDPQWRQWPRLERAWEIVRFTALRFEHWISPGGLLRGFLRLCIQIALLIGIPAVLLGPPLVLFFQQAVALMALLTELARQFLQAIVHLVGATVGLILLGLIWRALLRRK